MNPFVQAGADELHKANGAENEPVFAANRNGTWFADPKFLRQIRLVQPRLLTVFAGLYVPGWLLTGLTAGLIHWPAFLSWATDHGGAYRIIFSVVQISLVMVAIVYFGLRFGSALGFAPSSWWRAGLSLLCLSPLVSYHLGKGNRAIESVTALIALNDPKADALLASIFEKTWGFLAYGSSFEGVVCASILSFVVPVLEEMTFTGFLANALARRGGILLALLATPVCFVLAHVQQFGVGMHLVPLLWAGLTYVTIRIFSGSVPCAIGAHLTVNLTIFLPKWAIAFAYFRLAGSN